MTRHEAIRMVSFVVVVLFLVATSLAFEAEVTMDGTVDDDSFFAQFQETHDDVPSKLEGETGNALNPSLKPMDVDGDETFLAYVTPDVSTFYQEQPGSRTPQSMGKPLIARFNNLSPDTVQLMW
eukprot:scaffold36530_cov47-Attheya_sp.AAC.4